MQIKGVEDESLLNVPQPRLADLKSYFWSVLHVELGLRKKKHIMESVYASLNLILEIADCEEFRDSISEITLLQLLEKVQFRECIKNQLEDCGFESCSEKELSLQAIEALIQHCGFNFTSILTFLDFYVRFYPKINFDSYKRVINFGLQKQNLVFNYFGLLDSLRIVINKRRAELNSDKV